MTTICSMASSCHLRAQSLVPAPKLPQTRAAPRPIQCCSRCSSTDDAEATAERKCKSRAGRRALLSSAGAVVPLLIAESQGNVQALAAATQRAAATLEESMAAEGIVPVDPANYVPSPIEVGWEIWFGAFAGAFPFAIGLYEFTKRIMIQRRCEQCSGTGLVTTGEQNLEVKCPQCGGFFPWRSWGEFLNANTRPGNGGVLRFPKGQTSVFYSVPDRPGSQDGAKDAPAKEGSSEETAVAEAASSDKQQREP